MMRTRPNCLRPTDQNSAPTTQTQRQKSRCKQARFAQCNQLIHNLLFPPCRCLSSCTLVSAVPAGPRLPRIGQLHDRQPRETNIQLRKFVKCGFQILNFGLHSVSKSPTKPAASFSLLSAAQTHRNGNVGYHQGATRPEDRLERSTSNAQLSTFKGMKSCRQDRWSNGHGDRHEIHEISGHRGGRFSMHSAPKCPGCKPIAFPKSASASAVRPMPSLPSAAR